MKDAADRESRARAARARAEAEARGEVDAKSIADAMDAWEGKAPYVDPVEDVVSRLIEEGEIDGE